MSDVARELADMAAASVEAATADLRAALDRLDDLSTALTAYREAAANE
ncbi:hypothetical protein [Jiangella asiatica]|nr:hypothetical protein [Jiangella asiatica]